MSHGRGIRLFLVDGTPNGLLTAEIMNWTGHALTGPRTKLTELVQRPECGRTGVYFLVGPDPENAMRPLVYIGESDDVAKRLKQHNRPEPQRGSSSGIRTLGKWPDCLDRRNQQEILRRLAKLACRSSKYR